jgi:superoxide dismutase, Cu-Zn family
MSLIPKQLAVAAAALSVAVLTSCASMSTGPSAQAELKPTQGNTASGWVRFEQSGGNVLVTAEVRGLKPNAEHGFHVHEKGDCSAPDATSAGGHFNPASAPHAHYSQSARHAGDLTNLKADASGVAKYSSTSDALSVAGGATNNVVGRAVVVHRDPDDYKSQPAGNSGPRIACGVIATR